MDRCVAAHSRDRLADAVIHVWIAFSVCTDLECRPSSFPTSSTTLIERPGGPARSRVRAHHRYPKRHSSFGCLHLDLRRQAHKPCRRRWPPQRCCDRCLSHGCGHPPAADHAGTLLKLATEPRTEPLQTAAIQMSAPGYRVLNSTCVVKNDELVLSSFFAAAAARRLRRPHRLRRLRRLRRQRRLRQRKRLRRRTRLHRRRHSLWH